MDILNLEYYTLKKGEYSYEIRSTDKNPRLLSLGVDLVHDELLGQFVKFFRSSAMDYFSISKQYDGEIIPDSITGDKRKNEWYMSFNGDGFIVPEVAVLDFYKCIKGYIER